MPALFLLFLKAGTFVFGGGMAIVPFLNGGVVAKFHWLTERQFVDAVAVATITPGPVVMTVGFIVLPSLCTRPAGQSFCSKNYRGGLRR
jgi:chromate transporter